MSKGGIHLIGGGTFTHVRNHMSLAAPAFGSTVRYMAQYLPEARTVITYTKMADRFSDIETNDDLNKHIIYLLKDGTIGTIIMNAAVCDFNGHVGEIESDSHAERLKTADGDITMKLTPSEKIIKHIRRVRPDIFLVGFKTTTGASSDDQFLTALKFMKSTKCNLVLANDTLTRNNMIITPEETRYHETTSRKTALKSLCKMINLRQDLTYHRTTHVEQKNFPITSCPDTFQTVVNFLIDNGGFIENNGNGFTPGHFCWKQNDGIFLSSQRKADHNKVFDEGLTKVIKEEDGNITAYGTRKPSVGATSQQLLFDKFPQFDCIIHTHNPVHPQSTMSSTPQYPFQCGSLECGKNTADNIKIYSFTTGDVGAVYLEKHGANIMFHSSMDPKEVINFIECHLMLGIKES